MQYAVKSPTLVFAIAVLSALAAAPTASSQEASPQAAAQSAAPTAQVDPKARTTDRPTASAEAKPAAEDPNRMICRNAPPLGTRIAKKTCKTAAEWEELRKMGNEAARSGTERGRLIRDGEPGG